MIQIICKPLIHKFASCEEFINTFAPGPQDLILADEYVFKSHLDRFGLKSKVIIAQKYGQGEPTDVMVESIMADMGGSSYLRIFAIGGGTVIDMAKVLTLQTDGSVDPLYEAMPDLTRRSELIILPTTCGTGSEVTNISILNRTRIGTKMGLTSPAMYADHAVLVPELLKGLPLGVFATSSIDALVHAVESYLSPKATDFTRLYSSKAMEMLINGFRAIAAAGNTEASREAQLEDFLTASTFAGLAFGTAGCAAVHAMAYPLGGLYHVPHGESNYALFTGVLKNYLEIKADGRIAVFNDYLARLLHCSSEKVYDELERVLNVILPKKPLHTYGVTKDDLPRFTETVMTTQGRLTANNFVPLDAERVLKIYTELF